MQTITTYRSQDKLAHKFIQQGLTVGSLGFKTYQLYQRMMPFVLWISCWLSGVLEKKVDEIIEFVSTLREMQLKWVNKCRNQGTNPFICPVKVSNRMIVLATQYAPSWIQDKDSNYYLIPTDPDSRVIALNFILQDKGVWSDVSEWKMKQGSPQVGDYIISIEDGKPSMCIWTDYFLR